MRTLRKIIGYVFNDLLRSKWLISYGLFFWLATDLLMRFGGSDARAVISLMNIVLILVPLVALVFGMIYLYNAREFIELLLTQPVDRTRMFFGMYLGLSLPMTLAFLLGVAIPLAYFGGPGEGGGAFLNLAVSGSALTMIFSALAFLFSTRFEDRIKGLGSAVMAWLVFVLLYDGLIMLLLFVFQDYPLENVSIVLSLLNPVDLGRVFMLLQLDISALMGYTGAAFSRFFGSTLGVFIALASMLVWMALPLWFGQRRFRLKDF